MFAHKKCWTMLIFCLCASVCLQNSQSTAADALKQAQRVTADALKTYRARTLVANENMANARSAGYAPKSIFVTQRHDRKHGIHTVEIKRIQRNPQQMRLDYQPYHPMANADGYVMMPNVDPLISMVDMRQAQQDTETAYKAYQTVTDLRYKSVNMIGTH